MADSDVHLLGTHAPPSSDNLANEPTPPPPFALDRRYHRLVAAAVVSILLHLFAVVGLSIATRFGERIRTADIEYVQVILQPGAKRGSSRTSEGAPHKSHAVRAKEINMVRATHRLRLISHHRSRIPTRTPKATDSHTPLSIANPATAQPSSTRPTSKTSVARSDAGRGMSGADFQGGGNFPRLTGQAPTLLSAEVPEYPERARQLGIEGQVLLQIVVDSLGRVEPNIKVLKSIPALDKAAMEAVRKWRFAPARDPNGHPIQVSVKVPLRFTLQ